MRCEHCDRRFETYDGLYNHVTHKHGPVAQSGMMSPRMYAAQPIGYSIRSTIEDDSWVKRLFVGDSK
jgi:hypothetical protein